MDVSKMNDFLQMYKALDVLHDYDIIQDIDDMKISLLVCIMDEIEKVLVYLTEQKEAIGSEKRINL